jgi:hypothetical protein
MFRVAFKGQKIARMQVFESSAKFKSGATSVEYAKTDEHVDQPCNLSLETEESLCEVVNMLKISFLSVHMCHNLQARLERDPELFSKKSEMMRHGLTVHPTNQGTV